jgi:homopolymeric O-antigen transport system permease protein
LLAWLYLTPIIYPELIVPEAYRLWMFRLNPMYYLVKLFRLPLYEGRWPTLDVLAIGTALALGTATLGWIIFSRKADEFAYRI